LFYTVSLIIGCKQYSKWKTGSTWQIKTAGNICIYAIGARH
jgi:hypothetical protein